MIYKKNTTFTIRFVEPGFHEPLKREIEMSLFRSILFVLATGVIILIVSSSCGRGSIYNTHSRVSYNRGAHVKAYKGNPNRNSFTHSASIRKKYVLKK